MSKLVTGRLGGSAVAFFALAATAPILVLILVVPAAYARGGGPLVPLSFVAVALVLVLFAAGYAAMGRRAPFAGGLFTYVSRGLGRPPGIAAAWVAIFSYLALQAGLLGLAGMAASPLLRGWFDIGVPWWWVAAGCWAVVTICGTVRAEVVSGLLALVVLAEGALIAGYAAANLIAPAGDRITSGTIVPAGPGAVDRPALGLLLAIAVLAFVGFETPGAFTEESIRPRRDPGQAAYATVVTLGLLLAVAAWSMSVAAGADQIGPLARARGPEAVFDLVAARLAPWAVTLGRVLLLTGLVAAMIALHHTVSRYLFALGREHVLPAAFARTARRTLAPRTASLTQSLVLGLALAAAVLAGVDSPTLLAQRIATCGGIGILLVLLAASLSALLHLNRVPGSEGVWGRFFSPILATVALGALAYLAFRNLPSLLGVPPGDPLTWLAVAAIGGVTALGLLHGWTMRGLRPVRYAGVGQAGTPVVITPAPTVPKPRQPGAHRPERVNR